MEFTKKFFYLFRFFIYFSFYVIIYKNIAKRLYRLIIGSHEIQRCVIKNNNYTTLSNIIYNSENCILNSRQLESLHKYFKFDDLVETEKIINTIKQVKQINTGPNNTYNNNFELALRKILTKQEKLNKMKQDLKELYQEKFNREDQNHKAMLFQLWEKLKGNNDINLIDKRWCTYKF
jgi:hypothetical protein